jgi:hypothetical protein
MSSTDALKQAMLDGIEIARDPLNARITVPEESRITTMYSFWYVQVCRVCLHTFREGDLVRPDPRYPRTLDQPGKMLHEDPRYGLFCWSRATSHAPEKVPVPARCSQEISEAFLRGLHKHWHAAGSTPTELVTSDSPLVGRICPVCRHTVCPGDQVMQCPCAFDCGMVFHQDIARHMTCWDTWYRVGRRNYCALTNTVFQIDTGSGSE